MKSLKIRNGKVTLQVGPWCCGAVVLGCWGAAVLGCCGAVVLRCWGAAVLWCCGAAVLGCWGEVIFYTFD